MENFIIVAIVILIVVMGGLSTIKHFKGEGGIHAHRLNSFYKGSGKKAVSLLSFFSLSLVRSATIQKTAKQGRSVCIL